MTSVVVRHSLSSGITQVVIDGVKQERVIGTAFYRTPHERAMLFKIVYCDPQGTHTSRSIANPDFKAEYVP